MRFAKAHGLANDFILVPSEDVPDAAGEWARNVCARHTGVGADGVVLYELGEGRVAMRLYNADGSDGNLSGNGLRCLAAYTVFKGWLPAQHVVETPPGPRAVEVERTGAVTFRVAADMGAPILQSDKIPVCLEPPAPQVLDHVLDVDGARIRIIATSMGNPHCTLLLDEPATLDTVERLGAAIEQHPFFPNRTNVEFAVALSRSELAVQFWERGVGLTQASGTGSAAASVAAILAGRVDRRLRVVCAGGVLDVEWPEGGTLRQTGDVELLFEGQRLG